MVEISFHDERLSYERSDYERQCSFCLRGLNVVAHLIAGPEVSICSRCIRRCVEDRPATTIRADHARICSACVRIASDALHDQGYAYRDWNV